MASPRPYSVLAYRHHHGNLPLGPVAVLVQPGWAPAIILFALSILLFPDGHLPSGRWRIPLFALVASAAVWLAGAYALAADVIVAHDVRVDSTGNLVQGDHPTGNWAWWTVSQSVFFAILACVGVAWLVSQIPSYRRATGVRRAQLKWILLGAGTALVGGMLSVTESGSGVSFVLGLIGTLGLLGLPIGIGIGITRYRLYDIDRFISRTLSYALLTGLLVGVFAGLVLLTTRVLPFSSPVGVAASTLAALALFNPLRGRIQRVVDRRFNRAHYDAEAAVAAFSARLRGAVDVETVLDELAAAAGSIPSSPRTSPSGRGHERRAARPGPRGRCGGADRGELPAVGARAPAHVRRGRTVAADDPVRGRRHARREPAAAEPDRLAPARDRRDCVLRRRRRLLRRPRLPHRSPRPSSFAARRLPDPGVGVDARAPASADPLLPRRQDLATVALDARRCTSRSWPC